MSLADFSYDVTEVTTEDCTYRAGDVIRFGGAFKDALILGFNLDELIDGFIWVRLAQPIVLARCVGTPDPGVEIHMEELHLDISQLIECGKPINGQPLITDNRDSVPVAILKDLLGRVQEGIEDGAYTIKDKLLMARAFISTRGS